MNRAAQKLYATHIPTSAPEKLLLAVGSGFKALHDPLRQDMVAALGETSSLHYIGRLRDKMLAHPTGRRILRDRPVISSTFFDDHRVSQLPETTFGGAYYHGFMRHYAFSPDHRTPVHFIDNAELAYVMMRYRQVHDFWHTLTALPPTVEGEVALKVFEYMQTGLPMTAMSALLGPLKLAAPEQQRNYWTSLVPWAVKAGRQSTFLLNVYYEEELDQPLDELRKRLGLTPAPECIDK
ncbi:Ubiquinone biosynthesis protein [Sorochytrium milnesiophthora]